MLLRPNESEHGALSAVSEIDLKKLAEAKSEKDTFLSIYFPVNKDDHRLFVDSRIRAIEKALPGDLKKSFLRTLSITRDALSYPNLKGERGRVIFASYPEDFFQVFRLNLELEPLVVLSRSPFLLSLARLQDDYEDYGLLLIDSQNATLFIVRSDLIEEQEKASINLMNKHKKGGWSQMRFNRLRQGAIMSFLLQVAEDLEQFGDKGFRGLVVAGPGNAKYQLDAVLPVSLRNKLLDTIDTSIDIPLRDLVKLGDKAALESEIAQGKRKALILRDTILKGLPAAYGFVEVKNALPEGRVNHLLVLKNFHLPGLICMKCNQVHQTNESCPTCATETAALSLERLLELAQIIGAEVEFVEEDEFLKSIGGVGALLRY
ncbi:MAG: hypothetical protein MUO26_13900 [Methanotrichaceae archaeon]|nr:hypothetical protein [Methanotrichaceae archaeon]